MDKEGGKGEHCIGVVKIGHEQMTAKDDFSFVGLSQYLNPLLVLYSTFLPAGRKYDCTIQKAKNGD